MGDSPWLIGELEDESFPSAIFSHATSLRSQPRQGGLPIGCAVGHLASAQVAGVSALVGASGAVNLAQGPILNGLRHLGAGAGFRVQVALGEIAAGFAQTRHLLGVLDPFRGHVNAHGVAEIHDGRDDRGVAVVAGEVLNEALVDLDVVDRELLEVDQRGEARPEIVEGDGDAGLVQLAQDEGRRRRATRQEDRFRDLDLEMRRGIGGRLKPAKNELSAG